MSEIPVSEAVPVAAPEPGASSPAQAGSSAGIARAAGINSLGNVASRALGLVREVVVAGFFGASGATSAFDAVSNVPKMVYEMLVGGMLSAALVPVLSEYAVEGREKEMERILSVLLTLVGAVLVFTVIVLEVGARWVAPLLVGGFDAQLLLTATRLTRIIVPSILIYGLSGILQAYHYARHRFVYPAIGAPAHNLGLIVTTVLFARGWGIASLSAGVVVAALAQLVVQLPGLRGVRLSIQFDWRHPVVRRILKLYAPVVLSIIVANVGIVIDRNLASRTVNEAITYMAKATFAIQLPLGLVSMAISLAVLPTLSQIDARVELDRFKRTLSLGLRLVLVVIIPAAVLLLVLGKPFFELIYEHGAFTAADTAQTWSALRLYLIGLPFAAIDLPLVFAFYAQKDTVTPVTVGIITVVIYLIVAPTLAFLAGWGFLGLVVANSVQLTSHALIMLWAFRRRFAGLRGYGIMQATLKATGAALMMALPCYGAYWALARAPFLAGLSGQAVTVLAATGVGAAAYLLGARWLHIEEINTLLGAVRRRLGV